MERGGFPKNKKRTRKKVFEMSIPKWQDYVTPPPDLHHQLSYPSPWMYPSEINLIKKYLKPDHLMVEYGAGGSTLLFSTFVSEYHSIESDPTWVETVRKESPKNVHMHSVPVKRPQRDMCQKYLRAWSSLYTTATYKAYKKYIEEIAKIQKKINVVLIDGRARPQCARFAYDIIDKETIVFIHDWAGRYHYRTVLEKYYIVEEIDDIKTGIVALKKR